MSQFGCDISLNRNSDILLASVNTYPDCTNDFLGSCIIKSSNKRQIEPNLISSNILNGVTIFGVTGTYGSVGSIGSLASNMHRDSSTAQLTIAEETVVSSGNPYLNSDPGYRAVPRINKDDEGSNGGSVTYVDRSSWAATTCGTAQATIELRIADCVTVFGSEATWDGSVKGNAGQSVWKLVTRTGAVSGNKGREVWRDERTGLLWSSVVSIGLNWCKASGSNNIVGNPTAEVDPSNYCDNVAYQNTVGQAISACFEDGNINFTDVDVSIDSAGKAGLGRLSSPAVFWRLPTKYDYVQAEVNGIRFVLPEMGPLAFNFEWASTISSGLRLYAWSFLPTLGYVTADDRANNYSARCVGR